MKKVVHLIIAFCLIIGVLHGQNSSERIDESQVPPAVKNKEGLADGFPIEAWFKVKLSNSQIRFVAVYQQLNPASGKVLQKRQRLTSDGRITSQSEYRGNDKTDAAIYLGTGGVDEKFLETFNKKMKEFSLVSFEGFSFMPGNQSEWVTTHRLVLKDKKGQKSVVYYNGDGKEVDMSRYPIRLLESQEMD